MMKTIDRISSIASLFAMSFVGKMKIFLASIMSKLTGDKAIIKQNYREDNGKSRLMLRYAQIKAVSLMLDRDFSDTLCQAIDESLDENGLGELTETVQERK